MPSMPSRSTTKFLLGAVVSGAVGSVVKQALANNLEETDSKVEKTKRYIGIGTIAGATAIATASQTDALVELLYGVKEAAEEIIEDSEESN